MKYYTVGIRLGSCEENVSQVLFVKKTDAWRLGNKLCNDRFRFCMADWRRKSYAKKRLGKYASKKRTKGKSMDWAKWWYEPYPDYKFRIIEMTLPDQ